ncbi:MAG: lysine--tRNA ligase, partial [Deltaproteobacteria bacterium]|nr:lysine--tRNA ligase [Deltaproteobacteria bacterium]
MEKQGSIIVNRRKKLQDLKEKEVDLFPNDYKVLHTIKDILNVIKDAGAQITENEPIFVVAGRMMAINKFGKTTFIRFKDRTGQLQAYVRKDQIGDINYDIFKQLDIGDFIGLSGGMFKTKTGEWTILVKKLKLISKATRPLPEKFHGLKDPEKRYRQRYLDLIVNPDVREIFIKRSKIIHKIRTFFLKRDFLEVETPMMQPIPGGAEAAPFKTYHNALGMDLFLRIAPELYLKRLVVGGFERVFEINRNFRNEGVSTQHNPEFTMIEFYQAYSTYEDLMDLTQEMFSFVAREVIGSAIIEYQGNSIDLGGKWKRLNLLDSLELIGGIDSSLLNDREGLL